MKSNRNVWIKISILSIVLSGFCYAQKSSTDFRDDNVLSIGSVGNKEQINFKLLDQTDNDSSDIQNTHLLNEKADSVKDTKRKSFHALRSVEELNASDVLIIK